MEPTKIYYAATETNDGITNEVLYSRDELGIETVIAQISVGWTIDAIAAPKNGEIVLAASFGTSFDTITVGTYNEETEAFAGVEYNLDYFISAMEFKEDGTLVAAVSEAGTDPDSPLLEKLIVEIDLADADNTTVLQQTTQPIADITTVGNDVWVLTKPASESDVAQIYNAAEPETKYDLTEDTSSPAPTGAYTAENGKIYLTNGDASSTVTEFDPVTKAIDASVEIDPIADKFTDVSSRSKSANTEPPEPTIPAFGTEGDDDIIGTPEEDILIGLGGNDTISGLAGDDVLIGGEGDDEILGGFGNDQIFGGGGSNHLYGGYGDDVIFGNLIDTNQPGSDPISRDIIEAGAGDDGIFTGSIGAEVYSGAGDDYVEATAGVNLIFGGVGDDHILGGSEKDYISGGDGDDDIFGRDGTGTLFGDEGDDLIIGGVDSDYINGGIGDDVLIGEGSGDNLFGQDGNDFISGGDGDGDDKIYAGTGNDVLSGGAGEDALLAEDGNDVVFAGQGNDAINLGAGIDVLYGGAGADLFFIGKNSDQNFWADFEDGLDRITFETPVSQADFVNNVIVTSTLDGLSTYIAYGETALILEGVMADQIDEADFLLIEPLA